MSLNFLTPSAGIPSLSPLDAVLEAAGATFELRDGWRVATRVAEPATESAALAQTAGWADMSHLRKFVVSAPVDEPLGVARRDGNAWWCPVTRRRTLVLGACVSGLDVTTQYGALTIAGPAAREVIARFCAADLRRTSAPPASFRPCSVARTPGAVLVEAQERFLVLFGSAVAEYIWTVVSDAGSHLGGRAVGVDGVREELVSHA